MDPAMLNLIRPGSGVELVRTTQEATLVSLYDYSRMQRLIESSALNKSAYTLDDLFTDVRKGIWSELATRKPIDNFRRNLQKVHVERLLLMLDPPPSIASAPSPFSSQFFPASAASPVADPKKSDVISLTRAHLVQLKNEITAALPSYSDKMSRYHLQDVIARINKGLDPK
jgi:hypothetical protein